MSGAKQRQANPLNQHSMFREKDLFKATNLYTLLDKNQHIMSNKMFA